MMLWTGAVSWGSACDPFPEAESSGGQLQTLPFRELLVYEVTLMERGQGGV